MSVRETSKEYLNKFLSNLDDDIDVMSFVISHTGTISFEDCVIHDNMYNHRYTGMDSGIYNQFLQLLRNLIIDSKS